MVQPPFNFIWIRLVLVLDQLTAQRIVERTMLAIGHSVNVMSPGGLIIASGDSTRVGCQHEAARLVAERGQALVIDASDADSYPGVRPGVNLPVTVNGELAAVVGISGIPDEVGQFADLVCMTAELMLEQAALIEAGQHRRRQVEDTLMAACEGKPVPAQWFEQLGIDARRHRVAMILEATTREAVDQVLVPLVPLIEQRQKAVIAVRLSPFQLLLFQETGQTPPGPEEVRRLLNLPPRDDLFLAIGQVFSGHFQMGYQSAKATLTVGRRKAPTRQILYYGDFRVAALWHSLSPAWQQDEMEAPVTSLLRQRQGELYLKTLRRLIECDGQIQRCADELHVHANTVRYRLQKVQSITGLSPFSLQDLFILQLALSAH